MAKGKKNQKSGKNKGRPGGGGKPVRLENMSVSERLGFYWESGAWEIFLAEWRERSGSPNAAPWAPYVADAMYNHLTRTLFEDRNIKGAVNIARGVLKDPASYDEVTKACSTLALTLAKLSEVRLREGEMDGLINVEVPKPWSLLLASLSALTAPAKPKALTDPKAKARAKTIRKMERQLDKLEPRKPSYLFKAFVKSCEELLALAENRVQLKVFGAVKELAVLVKTTSSKLGPDSFQARDLTDLVESGRKADIFRNLNHPAMIAIWRKLVALGEVRWGYAWAETARSLVLPFDMGLDPEAKAVLAKAVSKEGDVEEWLDFIKNNFPWSAPERLILEIVVLRKTMASVGVKFAVQNTSRYSGADPDSLSNPWRGIDKVRIDELRRRFAAIEKLSAECGVKTVWGSEIENDFWDVVIDAPAVVDELERWGFPYETVDEYMFHCIFANTRKPGQVVAALKEVGRLVNLEEPDGVMTMATGFIWRLAERLNDSVDLDEMLLNVVSVLKPKTGVDFIRSLVSVSLINNTKLDLDLEDFREAHAKIKAETLNKVLARIPKSLALVAGTSQSRFLELSSSLQSPLDKASDSELMEFASSLSDGDYHDSALAAGIMAHQILSAQPNLKLIRCLAMPARKILDSLDLLIRLDQLMGEVQDRMTAAAIEGILNEAMKGFEESGRPKRRGKGKSVKSDEFELDIDDEDFFGDDDDDLDDDDLFGDDDDDLDVADLFGDDDDDLDDDFLYGDDPSGQVLDGEDEDDDDGEDGDGASRLERAAKSEPDYDEFDLMARDLIELIIRPANDVGKPAADDLEAE